MGYRFACEFRNVKGCHAPAPSELGWRINTDLAQSGPTGTELKMGPRNP